jgi:predicted RNA polymerase sigma factor
VLKQLSDNPMVTLNHAIAAAWCTSSHWARNAESAGKDEHLHGSHPLDAVRAHLLERAGEPDAALALYRSAAQKTTSIPERNYLAMRAARLSEHRKGTNTRMGSPRDE